MGLDRDVWKVSSVVILGAIMSILDTTIVNVALETLGRELHASLDSVQWVATGYLLALAIVIPLTGWAAERFGARRVWLTSVALFVAGSVLCGVAWSLDALIFFRILQGFGGGMIMPVGMILVAQAAGPKRMGRVMSVLGVPMLMAPILGPVIGGLLVDHASWRWIFFVNVPVGIVGMLLGVRFLPHPDPSRSPPRLDLLGFLLVSPGLGAIVFGLTEVSTHGGLGATAAWLPLAAGVVLVAAFVFHALRDRHPLIDVRLFANRTFAPAAATTFVFAAAFFGSLLLIPLLFQVARGHSALEAGLLQVPQGLGAALAMPIAGTLTDRIGGGRVAVVGLLIAVAGTVPFAMLTAGTPTGVIEGALFFRGIGVGATMMPAMAAAYAALDSAAVPRATSALNVLQRVGGSIGTALLAVVLQKQISQQLPAVAGGGLGATQALPPAARARAAEPLATAFAHTFWWAIGLTVLALGPCLVLLWTTRGGPVREDAAPLPV